MKKSVMFSMVIVFLFSIPLFAQKFAFVQSQRILAEYQEFVDVQNKINEIKNSYEAEYQKMVEEYNKMLDEIDSQSLLLSPEKKQEKLNEAQQKAVAIEQFKYQKLGPEGELYKKNLEFSQPIIKKINDLIAKIGEEEGYDFIFDASSGALVHALPKYDLTEKIIESLNKGSASTTTSAPTGGRK
ncbi:MAG: OmpH family outer membrane protein [Calditrichaceae bacterium]|nr:OmpH family outer membrane protein [Calditrichaceae bacterium]MBN2708848.1 OmpH family outer membrane protein [Calditrichaceae bacterium]RQV97625.1 MAG: OmpH family outer membrane protein [Calditrichota bacterium]